MKLAGSLPVIPTPFYNGKLDFDSFSKLLEFIFPALDGCTICGSTGEAVSLTLEERRELMTFAANNTPPGKKIVVGLAHTNLQELIQLARHAEKLAIAGGLVPCPYYFPNSFPMVLEFFRALDQSVNLELVLYDNPVYTKTWLTEHDLFTIIDACRNVNAVKMTDHNLDKIVALKKRPDVSVFSGDDVVAFRSLLLGVDGSMIIAPAVFPERYQTVVRLLREGDRAGALRVFSGGILPFIHLFGMGDEISTTKGLFKQLGIFRSDELRLPLLPSTPERMKEVILAYEMCKSQSVL